MAMARSPTLVWLLVVVCPPSIHAWPVISLSGLWPYASNAALPDKNDTGIEHQAGKALNFFPVPVSEECLSDDGRRKGVCLNTYECRIQDGVSHGPCALGFGVCCVFTASCGKEVINNVTYFVNPDFPGLSSAAAECTLRVKKIAPEISQLRLDFVHFNLGQPNRRTGVCEVDAFIMSGGSSKELRLCGQNHGQHIYYDVENVNGPISITMNLTRENLNRMWEVKITQIEFQQRAPAGCMQYYREAKGVIQTMNFADNGRHLADQDYSICMRQGAGMCSIVYEPCDENSFKLGPSRRRPTKPGSRPMPRPRPTRPTHLTSQQRPMPRPARPTQTTSQQRPMSRPARPTTRPTRPRPSPVRPTTRPTRPRPRPVRPAQNTTRLRPLPRPRPLRRDVISHRQGVGEADDGGSGDDPLADFGDEGIGGEGPADDGGADTGVADDGVVGDGGADTGGADFAGGDFGGVDFGGADTGGADAGGVDSIGSDSIGADSIGVQSDGSEYVGGDYAGGDYLGGDYLGGDYTAGGQPTQGCEDRIVMPCDSEEFIMADTGGPGVCDLHHCGSSFCTAGESPCRIESSTTPFNIRVLFGPGTRDESPDDNLGMCLNYEQQPCAL